ncbi:MAG: SAM-dependent DNA methyltransferase [Planctomycetota bacterium]
MPPRTLSSRPADQVTFGDFQTPPALAEAVVRQIGNDCFKPLGIVEPTCGEGNLLAAAAAHFSDARAWLGVEINPTHLQTATRVMQPLASAQTHRDLRLIEADVFKTDWGPLLKDFPAPLLIVGNPPWVTNTTQGRHGSHNLPEKRNREGVRGIEALTGSSNFDVAESVLNEMLDLLETRHGRLAMLCKTSVARRTLKRCWQQQRPFDRFRMFAIDSQAHFGASVDACLFMVDHLSGIPSQHCDVSELGQTAAQTTLGWRKDRVVGNLRDYDRSLAYYSGSPSRWRSGIKHDCAAVFELSRDGDQLKNGWNEPVDVEPEWLFPLMKSGSLLKGDAATGARWLLVTQRQLADDTRPLEWTAPKLWRYLQSHADELNRRASRVYKSRSPFAMFGIGEYTFAPWKVAISGFAKRPEFQLVGPVEGKPVVCDDTGYFLGFVTRREAELVCDALNRPATRRAIEATAKRPVTARILNQINPQVSQGPGAPC